MGQGPQKPDHGGNFYVMPRKVLGSVAWRHASLRARVVLDILLARHNGFNNGRIAIGIREIGEAIGDQNHGANSRALAELIELGFLECTSNADKHQSKTREYRITFISAGEGKHTERATHEYTEWRPADRQKRKFGGARTATPNPVSVAATATTRKISVAATATTSTVNRGFDGDPCVAVTASLLDNHSPYSNCRSGKSTNLRQKPAGDFAGLPLDELREWAKATIVQVGFGGQRQLAATSGVPDSIISRFRNGRSLPEHYRLRLQQACGRLLPYVQWKGEAA